jgi:hypothetical protein
MVFTDRVQGIVKHIQVIRFKVDDAAGFQHPGISGKKFGGGQPFVPAPALWLRIGECQPQFISFVLCKELINIFYPGTDERHVLQSQFFNRFAASPEPGALLYRYRCNSGPACAMPGLPYILLFRSPAPG